MEGGLGGRKETRISGDHGSGMSTNEEYLTKSYGSLLFYHLITSLPVVILHRH